MSLFRKLAGTALAGMMLAGIGCASGDPGRDRSTRAAAGLADVRGEIAGAGKQLDEAMAAVAALQAATGDLAGPFGKAKAEVNDVEDAAAKVTDRANDLRARAKEYQEKWAEQNAALTSADLKAAAATRAQTVRAHFAKVEEKSAAAKAAYPAYMTETKELLAYLSNDLTPAGLQAAGPAFKRSTEKGGTLRAALNDLTAELDAVAAELAAKK